MADRSDDVLTAMPWRHRFGLRRRLRRAWREGMAEQQADSLERLRVDLLGVPVAGVDIGGGIGEISYADGTVVRLWLCHRPALKALRSAVRDGDVALVKADNHGHVWALYFGTLEGRLPLMCRDLRVRRSQGGVSFTTETRAPVPGISPHLV